MTIEIELNNSQNHLPIDERVVRELVRGVIEGEGVTDALISIAFVDDAAIQAINRRHLNHDWPTDVITFPLSDPGADRLEAEIVVSAEMASTTARLANSDPQAELALYVVHGLLHLCGYDDVTPGQSEAMRKREDEVLRREGWSNNFLRIRSPQSLEETSSWMV